MDYTIIMEIQQGFKLRWHCMHSSVNWSIIVIVVAELRVAERVSSKGPEAIQVDIVTELQCQTGHHDTSAEAS